MMENKVRFDGVILNEPKLTEFNSILLRLQNKQEFTKKDGSQGTSSCTVVVSAMGHVAQEVVTRFKRGALVRVEGALQLKKTKNVDQEGREIYETWIRAKSINALPNGGSIKTDHKAVEPKPTGKPYTSPVLPKQAPYQAPKQPTPVLKKQPMIPIQEEPENMFEEIFDNDLPF